MNHREKGSPADFYSIPNSTPCTSSPWNHFLLYPYNPCWIWYISILLAAFLHLQCSDHGMLSARLMGLIRKPIFHIYYPKFSDIFPKIHSFFLGLIYCYNPNHNFHWDWYPSQNHAHLKHRHLLRQAKFVCILYFI